MIPLFQWAIQVVLATRIAYEGCGVIPAGDEGFTVIDLPEFGFDAPSGEAKIPGIIDGDFRNISSEM